MDSGELLDDARHDGVAPADEGPARDADDQPDGSAAAHAAALADRALLHARAWWRRLEPQIRGFVDEAFAPAGRTRAGADLFNDFAAKVSVKVACIANGFPLEDSDMLNRLVWRFFAREEGVQGMTQDGLAAMLEMTAYFTELIQKRRKAGDARTSSVIDTRARRRDRRPQLQRRGGRLAPLDVHHRRRRDLPEDLLERGLPALAAQGASARAARRIPSLIPNAFREVLALRHADAVPDARAQEGRDAARRDDARRAVR